MAIRIYLDQGHNPVNPNAGAEGNGLREQDIVFRIGVETAALLNADPDLRRGSRARRRTRSLARPMQVALRQEYGTRIAGARIILSACIPTPRI